jgi:beta-lactamase class D
MKIVCSLILISLQLTLLSQEFEKYYSEYNVKGSFMLYNMSSDKYFYFDSARCYKEFIPASTFKIPNSIIGLETGVIKDEKFVIPWDSVVRSVEAWNHDIDLQNAIKVSCVPYYQELARRVGDVKMKEMVEKLNYGNKNISGGVDKFWLTGELRISQAGEIDFLRRLYNDELPVSKRSMDITKKIMLLEDTLGYKVRAKTGWGDMGGTSIGWFVGWVEKGGNVYFFANNIESTSPGENFPAARKEITRKFLKALGVY